MTAPSASSREPKPLRVPPAQVHFPASDREEILRRIDQALASGQLTLGAIGRELEERFAEHHGARHAIAVHSGTSAIEIPLRSLGVAGSCSSYPPKVITAGQGGIIRTDDDHLADEARAYRDQGKASFTANVHTHLGYNWRMSEPHAAIAVSQLGRLDEFVAHRQR